MELPEGPIILSPDRLVSSFKREVIYKKPEIFKIACLRDIKSLFSADDCLYAGFGNRDTVSLSNQDALAYRSLQISMGKIFIINPYGKIYQLNNTYQKSYPELH